MKVYIPPANENWILDRMRKEWYDIYPETYCQNLDADIIWLHAPWIWRHTGNACQRLPVLTTLHHLVPNKVKPEHREDFLARDSWTNHYHVPNRHTADMIGMLTDRPISIIPYWVDPKTWYPTDGLTREALKVDEDTFLIGSFQRDTEGCDLKTPKLEKGPDLLADAIEKIATDRKVHVLLAGWRRQYIMRRLDDAKISYTYFDRPATNIINRLYNTIDLYIVSSRYEGGPQAILECALTNTPIISTHVGVAPHFMHSSQIWHDMDGVLGAMHTALTFTDHTHCPMYMDKVKAATLPQGAEPYMKLLENIYENSNR